MQEKSAHTALFQSLANGDEKSYEVLFHLYFPRLYAFSYKILNDSGLAKDVVQNVFLKIWETRSAFNFDHPEAFMYQMVRNASLNYIRHLKVVDNLKLKVKDRYLGEELYYIDLVGNDPYILIEKELEERILEVMESLPNRCLTVFRLSRLEGMRNLEIADRLGISIKAVEKQISKALQIYRHNFADYLPLHIILLVLIDL